MNTDADAREIPGWLLRELENGWRAETIDPTICHRTMKATTRSRKIGK